MTRYLARSARAIFPAAAGVAFLLVLIASGLLWAVSPREATGEEELSRLAQALRREASEANYRALAEFAAETRAGELRAQAAYALGMSDFAAGRWEEAQQMFRAAQRSRWLGERAGLHRAEAELELGAYEPAGRTLGELWDAGPPLEETARVLEAERRVRSGQARQAVRWLLRQPDLWHRPRLLFALGEAWEAAGNLVAAAETLQRIYYEFPLSPLAEPSREKLEGLRAELKDDYPAPSQALRRARAEELWAQEAYRGARSAYLDLSVRASEPTRTEARLRAALSFYNLGARRAACRELKRIREVTPALEPERRAYRVRCALWGGRYWEAEEELDVLANEFPRSRWRRHALLTAGRTALAQGERERAQAYYGRLLQAFPAGPAAAEAHWKLTWLRYRARDASSVQWLEEHLTNYLDSPYWERALYWRARAALAAGARTVGERLLAALREHAPREYLAQEAKDLLEDMHSVRLVSTDWEPWLERLLPPRRLAREHRSAPLAPAVRDELKKAEVLERLGLLEEAGEVLDAALARWRHPELELARARLEFAQGKYARASERLRRTFPGYRQYRLEELPREAWEILFPRPYWELIEREARRNDVDPYLVAALIRQESRFQREARSSAGALGLMQLMPATARYLARSRRLSRERLLEPALNIRLGTRFLARLLERFEGDVAKAVAAYNGGGRRIDEWARSAAYANTTEFVEDIPVTQTREFVYKVLRNYRFYRDLYAEPERLAAQQEP